VPLDPPSDLYGGVLFHQGVFRRLSGYRHLRATECLAEISPDGQSVWFGGYLPGELRLGDPGARDAAIHGIQACIPHATLLPIGVDRIVAGRIPTNLPLILAARERWRDGDLFVYDLEIMSVDGQARERWEGLRLRAVDRIAPPPAWRSALLAPHVERRLQELVPGSRIHVSLEPDDPGTMASRAALVTLLAGEAGLRHRPDGKPEVDAAADGDTHVSVSHAGDMVLTVTGEGRIGCDLEPVTGRTQEVWSDLLGPERFVLAQLITRERGESPDEAATRVWAAVESLKKAGVPHGAPLTLHPGGGDGWLLLRSGELFIGTLLAPVRELSGPAALAVLVEAGRAGL
jgi:enediyne polyketide synthase